MPLAAAGMGAIGTVIYKEIGNLPTQNGTSKRWAIAELVERALGDRDLDK